MNEVTYHPDVLKGIRDERGLTQSEVEDKCGVSQSILSKCERGLMVPSIEVLANLSIAYGVRAADLMARCFDLPSFEAQKDVA